MLYFLPRKLALRTRKILAFFLRVRIFKKSPEGMSSVISNFRKKSFGPKIKLDWKNKKFFLAFLWEKKP